MLDFKIPEFVIVEVRILKLLSEVKINPVMGGSKLLKYSLIQAEHNLYSISYRHGKIATKVWHWQ